MKPESARTATNGGHEEGSIASDDSLGLPIPNCVSCGPCIMKRAAVHVVEEGIKFRLVAIDLDGTALCTDKTLSTAVAGAINYAHTRGATICVASGRMPYRIMGYAPKLPSMFYAASFSGGCVFRVEDGKITEYLKEYPLPPSSVNSFLDHMAGQEGGEDAFGVYEREYIYVTNASMSAALKHAGIPCVQLPRGGLMERFRDSECAMKLWVFHRPQDSALERTMTTGLRQAVEVHGAVVISFTESYEIVSAKAGKEHALAGVFCLLPPMLSELCDQLGLSLGRDVLAFGDEGNDVAMLRAAAHSITPANGTPAAKQAAKAISAFTNDDGCVALELNRVYRF